MVLVHPRSGHAHERGDASKSVKSVTERCRSWNSRSRVGDSVSQGEERLRKPERRGKGGQLIRWAPRRLELSSTLTQPTTLAQTDLSSGREFWPYAASRVVAGKAAASHNSAARRCPWSIHLDVWGGVEGGVGSVRQDATEVGSILLHTQGKERCVGRQPPHSPGLGLSVAVHV